MFRIPTNTACRSAHRRLDCDSIPRGSARWVRVSARVGIQMKASVCPPGCRQRHRPRLHDASPARTDRPSRDALLHVRQYASLEPADFDELLPEKRQWQPASRACALLPPEHHSGKNWSTLPMWLLPMQLPQRQFELLSSLLPSLSPLSVVKNEWFCSTSQCTNPPVIGNYRMAIWRGNVAIVDEHSLAWRLAVSGSRTTFRIDQEPLGSVLQGQDY